MRRDRIVLASPIGNDAFEGWVYEPELKVNVAEGTISGFISFYTTAKVFVKSVPFTAPFADARIEAIIGALTTRIVADMPALAGTRTTETVDKPDQAPAIKAETPVRT